ncbi:hypothetical protein NW759_013418 [Fusarium solani]|nr:hypothetical protein NW759_013418 [Fusarium solani]
MSELDNPRRRTRPEDSSEDEEPQTGFSENAKGRYRSRVDQYGTKADWPREPLYQVGETVYLQIAGRQQPAGPYVIVSNDFENATYQLQRLDNGQRHPVAVPETSLRVPSS